MSSRAAGAAVLLAAGVTSFAAIAAPPPKPAPISDNEGNAASNDDVVVTARRDHGAVATDVKPEVSLNSAVIESLGAADLTEVFRELAPEIGGDATSGNASARGAPPVVLVNGQRIAGFSAIKDFPPEAVARIDIFPQKVALQYGFTPDQRVVNVVLREHYRAETVIGRYTLAPDTWRGIYRAKFDVIRITENSHWNVGLDFSHTDSIFDTTTIGTPAPPDQALRHTLAAQNDHLTLSGTFNKKFGAVTAELNASLDLDGLQTRPGLSVADGDLLTGEGLTNLISGPVNRIDRTVQARTNLVLNGKFAPGGLLGGWHWSMVNSLQDSNRVTRTAPALNPSGSTAAHPGGALRGLLIPSPDMLLEKCSPLEGPGCASTSLRRAASDAYLNGDLFALPAGNVTAALRGGFALGGIRGENNQRATHHERDEGSASANVDVPLTARYSAIGRLSIGANGDIHQLSDFGTLGTYGATLDWSPTSKIDLLASLSSSRQAPSLFQVGQASLTTPNLREYDFVRDTTTIVRRIEGGNAALIPDRARTARVRLQVNPLNATDLALSAEYTLTHDADPIVMLSAATAAAAAAFPGRFLRQNGYLTALNVSAVNGDARDTQQLRVGLNYSTGFGGHWPDQHGQPTTQRNQFQIALYDNWRLQDELRLAAGQPKLDLLRGDTISDDGGTPAHRIELQTSVSMRKVSADVSAAWQTSTTARSGLTNQLTFSQGVTFNLRIQINLAYQHWLTRLVPFLRGNLNLSADNLLGARTSVHDSSGAIPLAYSRSYLNPTGRTFRITLRKKFR